MGVVCRKDKSVSWYSGSSVIHSIEQLEHSTRKQDATSLHPVYVSVPQGRTVCV
jgi:sulfate adenylyltransferase subunit 1 (EFTu-like GTPase family)